MLVLTRREGESLRIGKDIVVKVSKIRGGQVQLGISAPKNIDVHREEIYSRIHREKNGNRLPQQN